MKTLFNLIILISGFSCCRSANISAAVIKTQEWYHLFEKTSDNDKVSVAPIASGKANIQFDVISTKEAKRRSRLESIWNWDFWCQLQPKLGNGSATVNAFYYDAQLDLCLKFHYTGTGGNQNNFKTVIECERRCKGTTYMSIKDTSHSLICALQPNAGLCLALNDRFYYDVNDEECKFFVYGGCGGNQNRFTTSEECYNRCRDNDDK